MATTALTADSSRRPVLLSFSLGTAALACAATLARFYLGRRARDGLRRDDFASVLAATLALVGTIFSVLEGAASSPQQMLEFDVLGQPWRVAAAALAQISVCLSFLGLPRIMLRWKVPLYLLIFLVGTAGFAFAVASNLQCRPLQRLWNPDVSGTCWNPGVERALGYYQGALSVALWWFLALFPFAAARSLMTSNSRWPSYSLSSLCFTLGIFAIARTSEFGQASGLGVYTASTFSASVLSVIEQNVSLVAAHVLPVSSALARPRHDGTQYPSRSKTWTTTGTTLSRSASTRPLTRTPSVRSTVSTLRPDDDDDGSYGLAVGWMGGIVKTVSVEVISVEAGEDDTSGPDRLARGAVVVAVPARPAGTAVPGGRERVGVFSFQQDWETLLRAGPAWA